MTSFQGPGQVFSHVILLKWLAAIRCFEDGSERLLGLIKNKLFLNGIVTEMYGGRWQLHRE